MRIICCIYKDFVRQLKAFLQSFCHFTYKVLHDRAPIYIQELLQLCTPSRNLRSSNRNLLVKPYFNLNSYGKRAFSVAAPELWNFKRQLKTFFLCELMNRDAFICYLIFYLSCTFIYFVVSV